MTGHRTLSRDQAIAEGRIVVSLSEKAGSLYTGAQEYATEALYTRAEAEMDGRKMTAREKHTVRKYEMECARLIGCAAAMLEKSSDPAKYATQIGWYRKDEAAAIARAEAAR